MRYIFYHYNDMGVLTLDYDDGYTQKKIRYVFYTLRQAIKKFRQDNDLIGKHIKIIRLF